MDSTITQGAHASVPCSVQEIVALGERLNARLACGAVNSSMKEACGLSSVYYGAALNTAALAELRDLLDLDAQRVGQGLPLVKDEGRRSIMDLVDSIRQVYRALIFVLLKASTDEPDEAHFSAIEKLDKLDLLQELTQRRMASVVRDGRTRWMRPRLELCSDRLERIGADLMLHVYVLKLAHHQMSPPQNRAGRFDEELAIRAFAERWLHLWQKSVKDSLKARQKRFRLRSIANDNVSECDDEVLEVGDGTNDEASEQKKSETASECSTIVDVVVVSASPEKEGKETKAEESSQSTSPPPPPEFSNNKKKKGQDTEALVSKQPDTAPQEAERKIPSWKLRIKSLFNNDAAAVLKKLGYHGANPQLEAWVSGPHPHAVLLKLPMSHEQVLQELKREIRKGVKPSWENALGVTPAERDSIEEVRTRAMLSDNRSRTCLHVSDRRPDLGNSFYEPKGFRRVVYLAVGEKLDTVFLTDPDGHELVVPLVKHRFWSNILTAYILSDKPRSHLTRQHLQSGRYELTAEDGTVIFANNATEFAKAGERYTISTRGPQRPPMCFGVPPQRPRCYVPSISSVASSVWEGPTWEMEQELGFGDVEPADDADDGEEKKLKLSDLVARFTNAPDADFGAEVADGVLGEMDSDSDDYSSSASGSTVD